MLYGQKKLNLHIKQTFFVAKQKLIIRVSNSYWKIGNVRQTQVLDRIVNHYDFIKGNIFFWHNAENKSSLTGLSNILKNRFHNNYYLFRL